MQFALKIFLKFRIERLKISKKCFLGTTCASMYIRSSYLQLDCSMLPVLKVLCSRSSSFDAFLILFRSLSFCRLCCRVFSRDLAHELKLDDFIQCFMMLQSLTEQFSAKDIHRKGEISITYQEVSALETH